MSTRNTIQHFWSPTEPKGAAVGDEWYNSSTNALYKRVVSNKGVVNWLELTALDSNGNRLLTSPSIKGYTETIGAVTVTNNALTISLDNGSFQSITTMAGVNAITLPTPTAGRSITLQIIYNRTPTSLTFSTPIGTIKYSYSVTPTPTLTNGKIDFYTFMSDGLGWYGAQLGNF